jgi:hypothetical protein
MEETMTLPVLRSHQLRTGDRASAIDPLRELTALQLRMGQLMTSMLGTAVNTDLLAGTSNLWTPLADVTETDDTYLVEIDLPVSTEKTSPSSSPAVNCASPAKSSRRRRSAGCGPAPGASASSPTAPTCPTALTPTTSPPI